MKLIVSTILSILCAATLRAQTGPGTALSFNGVGQRAEIPNFCANAPKTEVTVEFWQNAAALRSQSTFSQDDSDRLGFDVSNVLNAHVPYSDGAVYWDFGDTTGEGRLSYTPPESLIGSWQHFAFEASQTGNFMRIYRNGDLEAEKQGMTPFSGGDFDLDIGGESNPFFDVAFEGLLDEFRIWDVARSQADIQANLYRSLPLPQTRLVAYWRFDEGTGDVVHDASGNGNHGSLINEPLWVPSGAPFFPYIATKLSGPGITFTWNAIVGRSYQLQFATDWTQPNWTDSGGPITATDMSASASDIIGPDRQRFYRVVLLP